MTDSTTLHGAEHIQRYRETDGAEGYRWRRGTEILILTTVGRVSGQARDSALIFHQDGDSYVVVASHGGAAKNPQWYRNLQANSNVQVQVKDDRFDAVARTATAAERPRLWAMMNELWPDYERYQTKTEREIPVVILERTDG